MSQRIISFHYLLTNREGKKIDSSEGRAAFSFLEGAHQIVPGLEKQIVSLQKGDKKKIEVPAAEGYGVRDESMIITVPKEKLPSDAVKVGDLFRGGQEAHAPVFKVTAVSVTEVTLDGNHPLAGEDLIFEVEMVDFRAATAEELSHGHAHGPDGHHH